MNKWRVGIQKATIQAVCNYQYTFSPDADNKVVHLDRNSIDAELRKVKLYRDGSALRREAVKEKQETPVISVVDGDCLIEALSLKKQGFNPLVLNMASATNPGGGYKSGAGAQEENLFRRTNLFQYHEPKRNEWYPIPEYGGIYCPNASVIRASEQEAYEWLEVPETMSFVAVAAIKKPRTVKNTKGDLTLTEEGKVKTRKKIRAILNIGLDNGHDAIVLSAFGCGAFSNPPKAMAQLFYEVLSNEYAGGGENMPKTFQHISFAIFDDKNASRQHNPEGNLFPFEQRFANGLAIGGVKLVNDTATMNNRLGQRNASSSSSSTREQHGNENKGRFSSSSSSSNNRNSDFKRRFDEKSIDPSKSQNSTRGKGGGTMRQTTLHAWYQPPLTLVQKLVDMGFAEPDAQRALKRTRGKIEEALELLSETKNEHKEESITQINTDEQSIKLNNKSMEENKTTEEKLTNEMDIEMNGDNQS